MGIRESHVYNMTFLAAAASHSDRAFSGFVVFILEENLLKIAQAIFNVFPERSVQ